MPQRENRLEILRAKKSDNSVLEKFAAGAANTHDFFAGTRRCAQFSLGMENLIRPAKLARGFLKFRVTIGRRKHLYFRAV